MEPSQALVSSLERLRASGMPFAATAELVPWPGNPRRNDDTVGLVVASMQEVGWTAPLVVRREDRMVAAGHTRLKAALALGLPEVPVVWVALTDEQFRTYAVADNAITEATPWADKLLADAMRGLDLDVVSSMTGWGEEKWAELGRHDLSLVLPQIESMQHANDLDPAEHPHGAMDLAEDLVLPSSSKWGIPDLRADMLVTEVPTGVHDRSPSEELRLVQWNTVRLDLLGPRDVVCFYTEDNRFQHTWTAPRAFVEELLRQKVHGALPPDFSVWADAVPAVKLWNVYRARYVARLWQEAGLRILPAIGFGGPDTYEYIFDGLPHGAPVLSVQVQTTWGDVGKAIVADGIRETVRRLAPQVLIVYGGVDHQEWLEPVVDGLATEVRYLPSWTAVRRRRRKK